MKFTPEVIAALQILREHAENDFERHRINVLERDLTAPPQVEIVDDTFALLAIKSSLQKGASKFIVPVPVPQNHAKLLRKKSALSAGENSCLQIPK